MAAQELRQQSGPMAAIPTGNPHATALAPPGGIERLMPWFLSAMLHLGVVLIAVFMGVVIISSPRAAGPGHGDDFLLPPAPGPEDPPITQSTLFDSQTAAIENAPNDGAPGRMSDRPEEGAWDRGGPQITSVQPTGDDPLKFIGTQVNWPCPVVGRPTSGTLFDNAIGKPRDGGDGIDGTGIRTGRIGFPPPPPPPPGGYSDVVFVIDRSGSMMETFETLKANMLRSIARMGPTQRFDMIMFASGQPLESGPRHVVWADPSEKSHAARFLKDLICAGQTDPLPAIRRAFEVLAERDQGRTKAILLLTDGAFPDNAKVEQLVTQLNANRKVHVYTYIYGANPPDARTEQTMRRIARDNRGLYKYVSPN